MTVVRMPDPPTVNSVDFGPFMDRMEWHYSETLTAEQPMTNVPSFFRSIPFLITRDLARRSWL